jgi:hypothetical protein
MDAVLAGYFEHDKADILWSRRPGDFDEAAAERELFDRPEVKRYSSQIHRIERESTGDISSTNARRAAKEGDRQALLRNCSEGVADFVIEHGLYR